VVLRRVTTGSSVDHVGGVSNVRLSGGWRSELHRYSCARIVKPIVRQPTTLRVFAAAGPHLPCTQARCWDTGARVRSDPLGVSRIRSLRGKLQRAGPMGQPFARTVSDPRRSRAGVPATAPRPSRKAVGCREGRAAAAGHGGACTALPSRTAKAAVDEEAHQGDRQGLRHSSAPRTAWPAAPVCGPKLSDRSLPFRKERRAHARRASGTRKSWRGTRCRRSSTATRS
jgi:hypothetical protein